VTSSTADADKIVVMFEILTTSNATDAYGIPLTGGNTSITLAEATAAVNKLGYCDPCTAEEQAVATNFSRWDFTSEMDVQHKALYGQTIYQHFADDLSKTCGDDLTLDYRSNLTCGLNLYRVKQDEVATNTPTSYPTLPPTNFPSPLPTMATTATPTLNPTLFPTPFPTPRPTMPAVAAAEVAFELALGDVTVASVTDNLATYKQAIADSFIDVSIEPNQVEIEVTAARRSRRLLAGVVLQVTIVAYDIDSSQEIQDTLVSADVDFGTAVANELQNSHSISTTVTIDAATIDTTTLAQAGGQNAILGSNVEEEEWWQWDWVLLVLGVGAGFVVCTGVWCVNRQMGGTSGAGKDEKGGKESAMVVTANSHATPSPGGSYRGEQVDIQIQQQAMQLEEELRRSQSKASPQEMAALSMAPANGTSGFSMAPANGTSGFSQASFSEEQRQAKRSLEEEVAQLEEDLRRMSQGKIITPMTQEQLSQPIRYGDIEMDLTARAMPSPAMPTSPDSMLDISPPDSMMGTPPPTPPSMAHRPSVVVHRESPFSGVSIPGPAPPSVPGPAPPSMPGPIATTMSPEALAGLQRLRQSQAVSITAQSQPETTPGRFSGHDL
jgi:hypothetical protein